METLRYNLEINEDGYLNLPKQLLDFMGVQIGDSMTVLADEDGVLFLPSRLFVLEIADIASQLLIEKELTVRDILAGLDEERERLFKERYRELTTP